jgi:hypothetical protein
LADRELEILRDALREHVNALAVDIGPRTPLSGDSLIRAASYIRTVFEATGLLVTEQDYQYHGQRVTNLLATLLKPLRPLPTTSSGLITTLSRAPQVPTTMRVPSRYC